MPEAEATRPYIVFQSVQKGDPAKHYAGVVVNPDDGRFWFGKSRPGLPQYAVTAILAARATVAMDEAIRSRIEQERWYKRPFWRLVWWLKTYRAVRQARRVLRAFGGWSSEGIAPQRADGHKEVA